MDWRSSSLAGVIGLALLACSQHKSSDTPDASETEGGSDGSSGESAPVDSANLPPDQMASDAGADSGPGRGPDAEPDTGRPDAEGPDAKADAASDAGTDAGPDAGSDAGSEAGGSAAQESMTDLDSALDVPADPIRDSAPQGDVEPSGESGMGAYVVNTGGAIVTASSSNTGGDSTNLSLYASPAAVITVTQNFNPNNGTGAYNDHNVGVWYNGTGWAVFNEDK